MNWAKTESVFLELGQAFRHLHDVMALTAVRAFRDAGLLIPIERPSRAMDWSQSGPQTRRLAKMRRRQQRRG